MRQLQVRHLLLSCLLLLLHMLGMLRLLCHLLRLLPLGLLQLGMLRRLLWWEGQRVGWRRWPGAGRKHLQQAGQHARVRAERSAWLLSCQCTRLQLHRCLGCGWLLLRLLVLVWVLVLPLPLLQGQHQGMER